MLTCYLFHNPIEADSELLGTRWGRGSEFLLRNAIRGMPPNLHCQFAFIRGMPSESAFLEAFIGGMPSESAIQLKTRSQRKLMKQQGRIKVGRCLERNNEF